MIVRHQLAVTNQLAKELNFINESLDNCFFILQGKYPDTFTDIIDSKTQEKITVEEIIRGNKKTAEMLEQKELVIKLFTSRFGLELTEEAQMDRSITQLNADADELKTDFINIKESIDLVSSYSALTDKAYELVSDVPLMERLVISEDNAKIPLTIIHANMINDILDTVSYVLREIDPFSGGRLELKIEELKKWSYCHLNVVPTLDTSYDPQLYAVFNTIYQQVKDCLTLSDLRTVGEYITANVEVLPLTRRAWTIG